MVLLDRFAMPKRCGDCAYTHGTDAHSSEITRITADLCVSAGVPFHCHRPTEHGIEARIGANGEEVLCRGYVDALEASRPSRPSQPWQVAVAREALDILDEAKAGTVASDDDVTARLIKAGQEAQAIR